MIVISFTLLTTFAQSGVTWPTFHLSGKVLVAIDKFSSLQSGWIKINDGVLSLRILTLKPSCPVALLTKILVLISATCCGLISGMTKLVVGLSLDEIKFLQF